MAVVITALGAFLILVVLRDIWATLFRPTSEGALSHLVVRGLWDTFRRAARGRVDRLRIAGPMAIGAVLAVWWTVLALGWTLIFWIWMPQGFVVAQGSPAATGAFLEALYVSLVTLTTLGYGDITPTAGWLRVLAPLEAAFGFVLLTAIISWVLSLYPALTRQRALAHRITLMRDAEEDTGIDLSSMGPDVAERALDAFTAQVVVVRSDFLQFPMTYYFYDVDQRAALPVALPYLLRMAETGARIDAPDVRLRAAELRRALEDLAATLNELLVHARSEQPEEVLSAYAQDHLRDG